MDRHARLVWFFDLDDTLHDASHAIFGAIDRRMTEYVVRQLGLDEQAADRLRLVYWRRYGATMLGLARHHAIDPHHFLRETHDFDVAALLRAERGLARFFARLPGRKVLLTNAPEHYARAVLRELSLHPHIGARYTIERMRIHGAFRPKPSRAMLRHMLARESVAAHRAVLVDDSLPNLKAARAVGMRTVLVAWRRRAIPGAGRARCRHYVGLRVRSVLELPKRLAFLRK
jgi:putative hydrolase of the HAD superfamily